MISRQQRPANRMISARRTDEVTISNGRGDSEQTTFGLLMVLWRRRWIVVGCVVVAALTGLAYISRATPIYAGTSVLYVQQATPKIISDALSTTVDSSGYLFTQCEVIHSSAILAMALAKPGVADVKTLQGIENPVAYLKGDLLATPGKQGDLITVSLESTRAQDAALIVNAVVESYIDYQGARQKSTAVEVLKILQNEMQKREDELKSIQQQIVAYKTANPDLALQTDKGNVITEHLATLTDALTDAQMRTLNLKVAVDQAATMPDDPIQLKKLLDESDPNHPEVSSDSSQSVDPNLSSEISQARLRLSYLSDSDGPRNPEVMRTRRILNELENEEGAESSSAAASYRSMLQAEYSESRARETALQQAADAQRVVVAELNSKSAEYDELTQDQDRAERDLDVLDSRIKEVNVTEEGGDMTVSVLETAKPDLIPVRPKKAQTMGMAIVAGLMMGLGGALLRDMMDQRLRSTEEISALLDLPVLGAVPHINGAMEPRIRGQEIHLQPRSDVAETYRTVRTAIYFNLSDNPAKSILVTSPTPGDGKSTLTSNLAISIAQAGRRVLLIDADCRRPMQHKIFELKDGLGLSSILVGKVRLADVVQRTPVENLEVLQCGRLPGNPAELLNSQAFLDLLAEATARYDQVIIDSPPLVPVTDARILAACCDATVLVLRAEKSTRRLAEHASDALASIGANVLGVVVNDVPRERGGYYYYYYSRYGHYGQDAKGKNGSNGNGSHVNGNGVNGNGSNGNGANGKSDLKLASANHSLTDNT